jgi:hypothetical protein
MDNTGPNTPPSSNPPVPVSPPGPTLGERVHEFESHLPTLNQALSNIASFVPGFAGYKTSEDRRIADKQMRAVIGERLSKIKERLDGVVDSMSRAGTLDGLPLIDQSGRRLERLIDRMRFADYGYAAVFDRVQMGDAELTRIYQYDAAIMANGRFEDDDRSRALDRRCAPPQFARQTRRAHGRTGPALRGPQAPVRRPSDALTGTILTRSETSADA